MFLMELIIVIFFFALTSAVCIRVFVKAHDIADSTEGMNLAVLWAENAGEVFAEYEDDFASTEKLLRSNFKSDEYHFDLAFSEDDDYLYMDYSFMDNKKDTLIYSFRFRLNKKEVADGTQT